MFLNGNQILFASSPGGSGGGSGGGSFNKIFELDISTSVNQVLIESSEYPEISNYSEFVFRFSNPTGKDISCTPTFYINEAVLEPNSQYLMGLGIPDMFFGHLHVLSDCMFAFGCSDTIKEHYWESAFAGITPRTDSPIQSVGFSLGAWNSIPIDTKIEIYGR